MKGCSIDWSWQLFIHTCSDADTHIMKSVKPKKLFALCLLSLGFFGFLKAQDASIGGGDSGTCCYEKTSSCWVEDSSGNLFSINNHYFQKGSGACPED